MLQWSRMPGHFLTIFKQPKGFTRSLRVNFNPGYDSLNFKFLNFFVLAYIIGDYDDTEFDSDDDGGVGDEDMEAIEGEGKHRFEL